MHVLFFPPVPFLPLHRVDRSSRDWAFRFIHIQNLIPVAVTLGRLGHVCPYDVATLLKHFFKRWSIYHFILKKYFFVLLFFLIVIQGFVYSTECHLIYLCITPLNSSYWYSLTPSMLTDWICWWMTMHNAQNDEEKDFAFLGLCKMIAIDPFDIAKDLAYFVMQPFFGLTLKDQTSRKSLIR